MRNFFIIVFAFFLSINSSFAYKMNILPSSFCNKLYAKLNLGEKGITEKIEVFVRYTIEAVKINELNNNFEGPDDPWFADGLDGPIGFGRGDLGDVGDGGMSLFASPF